MKRLKTLASALIVALVVITCVDYAASAATGGKFILGNLNKANKQSVLKRTTSGPALGLVTKSSSNAPLTTNGRGKVGNLNSDLLDGLDQSAFGRSSTATRAFASFGPTGLINPGSVADPVGGTSFGLTQANVTAHAIAGTYCFHPSFTPKSAMVSPIGDLGVADSSFIVATVSVRTNKGLSGCGVNDTVRVRTYKIPNGVNYEPAALADEPFTLWLK